MKHLKDLRIFWIIPFLVAFMSSDFLNSSNQKAEELTTLPDFKIELIDSNKTIQSKDLRGKYTLIDVWSPSCGVCVKHVPDLQELNVKNSSEEFEIISIALSSEEKVREFRTEEYGMPWKHALAERSRDGEIVQALEVKSTPTYYLVSPEGEILATNEDFQKAGSLNAVINQYL